MQGVATVEDRTLLVPPGKRIVTGYVDVFKCRFGNRARISVGDVGHAFQKHLQLGDSYSWPCPNGEWVGDEFDIHDGRHELIASLMLGREQLLVAWLEDVV